MVTRRPAVVALAGLCCAAAVGACGSASTYSTSGSGPDPSVTHAFVAFSQCMRANGVSNFPDPKGGGGIQLSGNINPAAPAFKSARSKCKHLLPGGGPPSGPPSAQDKLHVLQISECMRRHGVTGFPDPTDSLPSSPDGYGEVLDMAGAVLAVPSTIDTASPAFKAAAKACGFGP